MLIDPAGGNDVFERLLIRHLTVPLLGTVRGK
jgi:hypothetical protein